jgi:hypothetical protein
MILFQSVTSSAKAMLLAAARNIETRKMDINSSLPEQFGSSRSGSGLQILREGTNQHQESSGLHVNTMWPRGAKEQELVGRKWV